MLSAEGTGKTIEQAIENALFELKASKEDVDIKILSEGGLFKKAKVVVTISEDARGKYEKHRASVQEELKGASTRAKEACIKTEKPQEENAKKVEIKEEEVIAKKVEIKEETAREEASDEEENSSSGMDPMEFLKGFFESAGREVEIRISEDDKYITYSVEGDNLGDMIGHRGECYYAINRLLTAVTGRQKKRVLLDIGGYREKRTKTLTNLAKRNAEKVAKTGRYVRLEPMNPSDRRIIHNALSDDGRVVTMSKGEDPRRYVMIFPKGEND